MSKVIMYHYIRCEDKEFPNFKFLHNNNFKKQLNFFEKKNSYLKIGDNLEMLNKKKNTISLSFDDGIKDHFNIAKYLEKKNFLGFFFIPSYPYLNKDFIGAHKIHLVLGKYHVDEVINYLNTKANKIKNIKSNKLKDTSKDTQINETKNKIEIKTLLVKKKLNYLTKNHSIITNRMFDYFINKKEQKKIFKNFYLSIDEIKEMNRMGMCIGAHGHSHQLLSNLNITKQTLEIKKSQNFLEKILKKKIEHFCYPFGGHESYNINTIRILKKLNFNYSFTVENISIPNKINYLEIPRIDCNKFTYGKSN